MEKNYMETKETLPEKPFKNNVTITLSAYEIHQLLKVFDNQLCICNREHTNTIDIYEKICSQIHYKDFVYHGSEKHKRLDPEYFKKLAQEEENKKYVENVEKAAKEFKRVSWWKFGRKT